jgi:hypothetical protein
VKNNLTAGLGRFCLVVLVSTLSTTIMAYLIAIDKQSKQFAKNKIINTIRKWKN